MRASESPWLCWTLFTLAVAVYGLVLPASVLVGP